MVTLHSQSLSDDSLVALAAQGDDDARQLLATRLRKLRWMGRNDAAKSLAARAKAQHVVAVPLPSTSQETD